MDRRTKIERVDPKIHSIMGSFQQESSGCTPSNYESMEMVVNDARRSCWTNRMHGEKDENNNLL